MPRKNSAAEPAGGQAAPTAEPPASNKTERLIALLRRGDGATLDELLAATGWQAHSVRGALAGALKKKGLAVTSAKTEGVRRYRIAAEGEAR